jgi:hypothetical protein
MHKEALIDNILLVIGELSKNEIHNQSLIKQLIPKDSNE